MTAQVIAVPAYPKHRFAKEVQPFITLLARLGVKGDAHCGETMRHRSRWAKSKVLPNIRQVHLIHAELFPELAAAGFTVRPCGLGENITTQGIDLLALPQGAGCG